MADQPVSFNFDFSPHNEYQPYSGDGGKDPLEQDGFYKAKIIKCVPEFTKKKADGSGGLPAVKVHFTIEDEDAKGKRQIKDVLCGGKDRNSNDLGRQFCDLLVSAGVTTTEKIQANATKKASLEINQLCEKLKDKIAHVEIEAASWDGKDTSEITNILSPDQYQKQVAANALRRKRKAVNVTAQQKEQASNMNYGGASGGGAPANGATAGGGAAATGGTIMPEL